MGTEAGWVPLVVAAIGAGVQQYNTSQTAKKRDAEIARGIRESSKQQQAANQKIGENLNQLEKSRVDPYQQDLNQIFLDKIQKKRLMALNGLESTPGAMSDAYKTATNTAKTGAIDYGELVSSLLSSIDAAGNQRQAESNKKNDTGMDLLKFKRNSDQDSFLAQLRASRIRDNPLLSIVGSGLSGYASGMGYSGAGVGGDGFGGVIPDMAGSGEFNTGLGLDKYMMKNNYRGING